MVFIAKGSSSLRSNALYDVEVVDIEQRRKMSWARYLSTFKGAPFTLIFLSVPTPRTFYQHYLLYVLVGNKHILGYIFLDIIQ